jgi:VanZ family protein
MQREKIKTTICWLLVAICMAVIFWLSSRTADESALQSGAVLEWLINHFGDNIFTDFIVRKLAHFLEFTGLCLLFNIALYQTKKRKMLIPATVFTSFYAITDEVHQLFVDGRSCQFSDWAIDTAGAILGTIAFAVLFAIANRLLSKKNTIDRTIN